MQTGEVPTMVPPHSDAEIGADLPAGLAEIVAGWNTLPDAIRASVMAQIRAAR